MIKISSLLFFLAIVSFASCNQTKESITPTQETAGSSRVSGSTSQTVVTPSATVTKEERALTGFSAIQTSAIIDVVLTVGDTEKVVVETSENIQPYVVSEKVGDALSFRIAPNVSISGRNVKINVFVSAKAIHALTASGAASIKTTNKVVSNNLTTTVSGAGSILADVASTNLTATLSGAGKVNLTGRSDLLKLTGSGSSEFAGFGFNTNQFDATLSTASKASLTVNQTLRVTATGTSTVNYKGTGLVTFSKLARASRINKL